MITSTSNPHIKAIRKLADPKGRAVAGTFLAEGLRVVGQALDSDADIREVIFSEELLVSNYGRDILRILTPKPGVEITEVNREVFESLARKEKPQGIAAVIRQSWLPLTDISGVKNGIWVALEAVQNPGNLGTILRTCDAVGAKGLILLDHSTDPYDPAAVKASMGAIFTIPVFKTDLEGLRHFLQQNPAMFTIGTSDKAYQDSFEYDYPNPLLLLMGSEREGLSASYQELSRKMLRIPMEGENDSLNLSVATGIMLYQIYNQHRKVEKS
ncbi:MAG: RNA methyltransferase [Chloroflexi bacterium]|nr:RNA methyltransferase [Chloroflexota bacterium]